MLEDDRQIDEIRRMSAAHDVIRIQGAGGEDDRRLLQEWLLGGCLLDQVVLYLGIRDDDEAPILLVAGGRRQAPGFEDPRQLFLFNGFSVVFPDRAPVYDLLDYCHR